MDENTQTLHLIPEKSIFINNAKKIRIYYIQTPKE